MKVTVVILTHHRLTLIKECLQSIENQEKYPFEYEIVALLNGTDTETEDFLLNYQKENHNFKFLNLKMSVPVGEARNRIIDSSSGDYLCFIDDDVEIPKNYFQRAGKVISDNESIDVFGGPDRLKSSSSKFQIMLSAVMESRFAMGLTAKRHSSKFNEIPGDETNLILCNLWMKRILFSQGFAFPKGYIRNEENILLAELKQQGKKLLYLPDFYVFHERKESFKKLIRVTFLSGLYRTYGFFDQRNTFKFIFLVPQLFLASLVSSFFLSFTLFKIILTAYIIIITGLSLFHAFRVNNIFYFPLGIAFYLNYNIVYGVGQFFGYFKRLYTRLF